MEPKYSVHTDKELLRFGADVIRLDDASIEQFRTDSMADFVAFVRAMDASKTPKLGIYFNDTTVSLYNQIGMDPRNNDPIAVCSLKTGPRLALLIAANRKALTIESLEMLLRQLKANGDRDARFVLDNIQDFRVQKVTKIERKKERGGNYRFLVSRESAGTEDFPPPEKISFNVPLFAGLSAEANFSFELAFDFKQGSESVSMEFTLENLNLDEELLEKRKAALVEMVSELGVPSFWGAVHRELRTDEWSHKINRVE